MMTRYSPPGEHGLVQPLPKLGAPDRTTQDDERLAPPDLRVTVERLLALVWRWRWRSLATVLVALALGTTFLLFATERFTSNAVLIVGFRQPELVTPEQGRDVARVEPDIDGAIELMKSPTALTHVATKLASEGFTAFQSEPPERRRSLLSRARLAIAAMLGRARPVDPQRIGGTDPFAQREAMLRRDYKIERIGRSTLVNIAYTSTDPALAAQAANALANFSAQDNSSFSRMSLSEQSGFQLVRTSIVSAASVQEDPSYPNTVIFLGASLLLGLAAAATVTLLSEYRSQQTVRSADGLARHGMRSLGLVPSEPERAFNDGVTALQATLWRLHHRDAGLVLMIASAHPGEGKSTIAAALAQSLAATGRKVLLVDADLRAPVLHQRLGRPVEPGLATCIRAGRHIPEAVQPGGPTGVGLLAAGAELERPFELLASPQLRGIVEEWRRNYDVVLVDTSPVASFGDARMLAGLVDSCVMLARWAETSWTVLRQAVDNVEQSGGQVAGVVISRADASAMPRLSKAAAKAYASAYGRDGATPPARS